MENTVIEGQENGTATGTQDERTFTQAELDEIVKARLAKERAKYGDYETLQQKASKFDEMEEANKSELQKATEKAESLQKQVDAMTKEKSVREIREKVAGETGVPTRLLNGETEEACTEQAKAILEFMNQSNGYPTIKDGGEANVTEKKSEIKQFEDWFKSALN